MTDTPEYVSIERDRLATLVDTIVTSLDWGSGFLDIEDVEALWAAADVLEIKRFDVTPWEFKHLMPHKFETYGPWYQEKCKHCLKGEEFECHSSFVD